MTRDEIVTALRCCAEGECHGCTIHNDKQRCQERVLDAAADLIENQQRHIEALMKANAGLRDTVLYPESVEALKLSMMGKAISEITEFDGLPIDRLRELADADKDGRVVVQCRTCRRSSDGTV